MELRLLIESDVPALTQVLRENHPRFTSREQDVALWFKQAPRIIPGFFEGGFLVGAVLCEPAGGDLLVKEAISRPAHRTESSFKEALELLKGFTRDQGLSKLRMEICAQDGMRAVTFLVQAGMKVARHIAKRHGLEAGVELTCEVKG